jgi:hypothetical protein
MPLSAPRPSWATLTGKPTTVAGLALSDFNAQAIAAQASATLGAVGTYCSCFPNTDVAQGATVAGSALQKTQSGGTVVSAEFTGTWRNMGGSEFGASGSLNSTWLRIA